MDKMEYSQDDMEKFITDSAPELISKLKLDVLTLAKLRKAEVVTESLEDELKPQLLTPFVKTSKLLDDLKIGPVERFLNFCRILKEGDQRHIVEQYIKVDMDVVYAQLGLQPADSTENMDTAAAAQAPPPVSTIHPLWSKEHPNGQRLLEKDEDLINKLRKGTPMLKRLIRPENIWAHLGQYAVMDDGQVEECQEGRTAGAQVEAIIKFLKKGEVWMTHAFFRSLAQVGQAILIDEILGEGHKEYYSENLLGF